MIMPTKEWQDLSEWANRNHWTEAMAIDYALANNEIAITFSEPKRVCWSPTPPPKPGWHKISKSDV